MEEGTKSYIRYSLTVILELLQAGLWNQKDKAMALDLCWVAYEKTIDLLCDIPVNLQKGGEDVNERKKVTAPPEREQPQRPSTLDSITYYGVIVKGEKKGKRK